MSGRILSPEKFTYSAASGNFTPAGSPTDVFYIQGVEGKKIHVISVVLSASQTTGGQALINFPKRSSANSGGTAVASTKVPHSSKCPASTATVQHYTANPTTGTLVGNVGSVKMYIPAVTEIIQPFIEFNMELLYGTPIMLHAATEAFAVNLAAATLTGGSLNCTVTWTEEIVDII